MQSSPGDLIQVDPNLCYHLIVIQWEDEEGAELTYTTCTGATGRQSGYKVLRLFATVSAGTYQIDSTWDLYYAAMLLHY